MKIIPLQPYKKKKIFTLIILRTEVQVGNLQITTQVLVYLGEAIRLRLWVNYSHCESPLNLWEPRLCSTLRRQPENNSKSFLHSCSTGHDQPLSRVLCLLGPWVQRSSTLWTSSPQTFSCTSALFCFLENSALSQLCCPRVVTVTVALNFNIQPLNVLFVRGGGSAHDNDMTSHLLPVFNSPDIQPYELRSDLWIRRFHAPFPKLKSRSF